LSTALDELQAHADAALHHAATIDEGRAPACRRREKPIVAAKIRGYEIASRARPKPHHPAPPAEFMTIDLARQVRAIISTGVATKNGYRIDPSGLDLEP
jgi:hypothetical protein